MKPYTEKCAITWKNSDTKNQRTAGCRSTGSTGTRGAPRAAGGSRISGRRSVATSTSASVIEAQPGKWPMPKRSNHSPATNTVTRKPAEPHSRMRP